MENKTVSTLITYRKKGQSQLTQVRRDLPLTRVSSSDEIDADLMLYRELARIADYYWFAPDWISSNK